MNGASVDYSYDVMNRLASVKDNGLLTGSNTTAYNYDDVGNLHSYQYPNEVSTTYTYNSLNRLTDLNMANGPIPLMSYGYTLGAAGNRTSVTEAGGRTVSYTFDALYRLTNETITGAPSQNGSITYSYDAAGNRLSRTSSVTAVPSTTSSYDNNDRLTSDAYDDNGNTTGANGNGYSYDFENHLTSLNSGQASFSYDGDGNLAAKTVNGVTTRYLVDTNNPTGYAQVVDELAGNQVTRTYTYGHSLLSQRQLINNQWQVSFYGYDGQASVRLLTDLTGAITDTYTYDAFGNLIASTGNTPNEHLYTSERFDANLGFYYLRARYLNPVSSRFQTMDSVAGMNFDPRTLHKYTYAENDPVNRRDPSGHMSIAELSGAQVTGSIIAAMAVLSIVTVCYFQFALAETANYYGADTSSVQSPCVRNRPKQKRVLFHYTLPENVPLILGSQRLWPSLNEGGGDATYGFGQYFTDISPMDAGTRTMFQLSFSLYRISNRWGDVNRPAGYLAIDVSGLPVKRVAPVYGPSFPGKGIYLHETVSALPLRNRVESFGVVPFN